MTARRLAALLVLAVALLLTGCASAASTPSARAARAPKPGSVRYASVGLAGNTYRYIVYTPRRYRPGRRLPLIVMLHGCASTAYAVMQGTEYNQAADRHGFVVVYPEVDHAEQVAGDDNAYCWQYYDPRDWTRRSDGDPAAVVAIVRAVQRTWSVDARRIYLEGFSSGGFLAADMAALYPRVFAAVAENAGGAYRDYNCCCTLHSNISVARSAALAYAQEGRAARVVPRLVMGGDLDNAVPPACADKALEQGLRTDNLVLARRQTAPIPLAPAATRTSAAAAPGGDPYSVSLYEAPGGCVVGERVLVHGMIHHWPGGSSDPRYSGVSDPRGPNGTALSWQFFSRFALGRGSRACGS
jgi:poly(hydroxyalkanoate) depolymerase family esterase